MTDDDREEAHRRFIERCVDDGVEGMRIADAGLEEPASWRHVEPPDVWLARQWRWLARIRRR